jgi:hypothetical protein
MPTMVEKITSMTAVSQVLNVFMAQLPTCT